MADDFFRWLNMVRPSTDADDHWSDSVEADAVLAAVYRRIRPRRRLVRSRTAIPVTISVLAAAVVVLVTTFSATPPPARHDSVPHIATPALRPAAQILTPFRSCADLLEGLRAHTAAHVSAYGLPGVGYGFPSHAYDEVRQGYSTNAGLNSAAGAPVDAAKAAEAQTSTTNVQEAGVDEPDIVKTQDNRVVTVTDGMLRVIDTVTRAVTGSLDLTIYSGWQSAQLLVSGDHAVVVLNPTDTVRYATGAISAPYGLSPPTGKATVLFVDLGARPSVTGSLHLDGRYLDARMVGSTVRLVASSAPSIVLPASPSGTDAQRIAAYRKAVVAAPLDAWLPTYTVATGATTTARAVPCDQVSHPVDYTGASVITVYSLNLANLGADPAPISVVADGDTVYATQSSLYVASNPQWWCCAGAVAPKSSTDIHRFDIAGTAKPTYLGSGTVPGRLLNQYSLSEYDGALRVATSSPNDNGLYVLNSDTLAAEGHLGGLGKGQQIYAVRFLGSLAYVVTFRQTDPLYVIDLSDPTGPRVSGTLELSGYSDYLHDAGDGRLIGVGQDANAQGTVAGLQVSLFDVGNGAAPKRTGHVVLPGVLDEASLDPHQFLYWAPTGLIAVPTQSWNGAASGRVLVLTLHGMTLGKVGLVTNPRGPAADDGLGIQRSLIVDGDLWTVSGGGLQVSDPTTLSRIAWVPFAP